MLTTIITTTVDKTTSALAIVAALAIITSASAQETKPTTMASLWASAKATAQEQATKAVAYATADSTKQMVNEAVASGIVNAGWALADAKDVVVAKTAEAKTDMSKSCIELKVKAALGNKLTVA
jgi:glucose/arabinose dehydrogenase